MSHFGNTLIIIMPMSYVFLANIRSVSAGNVKDDTAQRYREAHDKSEGVCGSYVVFRFRVIGSIDKFGYSASTSALSASE